MPRSSWVFRGVVRWLFAGIVVCLALVACSRSADDTVESITAVTPGPLPTAQGLLPPVTPRAPVDAEAAGTETPSASPDPAADASSDAPGLPLSAEAQAELLAQWQENNTYERDIRNAAALIDVMFDDDGSLATDEAILSGFRDYAAADPALAERVDMIEAELAGLSLDADAFAFELAFRTFPGTAEPQRPLDEVPQSDELRRLVAGGDERLSPLKPTFFPLVQATIALASGQIEAPDGTPAALLVEEVAAEAEAVYGPVLDDALAELEGSIPDGAAFDSNEARRAFGRFVGELIDQVGLPALGD